MAALKILQIRQEMAEMFTMDARAPAFLRPSLGRDG